jgi:hypothetical protein
MSFGAGGGGPLPNHEHTNIPLDGGPLDFLNTTIASMNQGSITFSDGAALQELIMPAVPNNEVLTFPPAATSPSWQAAGGGGGVMELVGFTRIPLGGTTTTLNISFAAIDRADISELLCIAQGANGGNDVGLQINGNVAGYATQGSRYAAGVETIVNTSGQAEYNLVNGTAFPNTWFSVFHVMATSIAGDNDIAIISQVGGATASEASAGICTTNTGSFTSVRIGTSGSNSIEQGTWLGVYKVLNT